LLRFLSGLRFVAVRFFALVGRDLVERGYYQGSNVSYNVKKLTDFGCLNQERSLHDRRSVSIRLTDEAKEVVKVIHELEITTPTP